MRFVRLEYILSRGNAQKMDEIEDGITAENIVTGKRMRKPVERYVDPEMMSLMLADVPPEEIDDAVEGELDEEDEIYTSDEESDDESDAESFIDDADAEDEGGGDSDYEPMQN